MNGWERASRPSRARLVVALVVATMLAAPAALAAVNPPTAGSVVRGLVTLTESGASGGSSSTCGTSPGQLRSRIEVWRLDEQGTSVELVHSATNEVRGSWSTQWDSVGQPNGTYRVLSHNVNASGSSGCTIQPEVVVSDFQVTLENAVALEVEAPDTLVTGEALTIEVSTEAEGRPDVPLADQEVTITAGSLAPQTVTTDTDGTASLTIPLPDLPAGDLPVTVEALGEEGTLLGATVVDTVVLERRSTAVAWTGDTAGTTGAEARLEGRVIDVTEGSARHGQPIPGLTMTLALGDLSTDVTTDTDGRGTRLLVPGVPERQVTASATIAETDVYAGSDESFVFLVRDAAAGRPPRGHGLLGGLTRLVGGTILQPSGVTQTVVDVVGSLVPQFDAKGQLDDLLEDLGLAPIAALQPVEELVSGLVGVPVASTTAALGDALDPVLEGLLDQLGYLPQLGPIVQTLRFEWQTSYVTPGGASRQRTFEGLIGVPNELDVDGDNIADVIVNLTLEPTNGSQTTLGIPAIPVLDFATLPTAPSPLPLSIQAALGGEGLLSFGDGRLRIGFDTRSTSAPDRAELRLSIADGGFDLYLTTRRAHDIAITGAFEGDGGILPFGADPEAPSFDDPIEPAAVGDGETRFGITLSPAPPATRIGLGIGGGTAGLGVDFAVSRTTDVGLSFVQDDGGDELTAIDAVFEQLSGRLALVLDAGATGGDDALPQLGLQLLSDGLDRVAVQARSYVAGAVTSDMLLNLVDVPSSVVFGVGEDGNIGLTASDRIGLLEAGFSSGGVIATLDEPAFLYLLERPDFESVAIRLPQVNSLTAGLTDQVGLELQMAPTALRAKLDTPESALDAAIYDVPAVFSLGLAADGAFLIEGSAPIDLITLDLHDSTGALAGASDVRVRIEDIKRFLSVALVGEEMTFDTGGQAVGLLELFVGETPPIPAGEDALYATFSDTGMGLGVRVHGLRTITAGLDLAAPEFLLDTVAGKILNLNLAADGLAVQGRIDYLQPNLRIGIAADDEGNLGGLLVSADAPANSIFFDVPGLATFTIFDPMPTNFVLSADPVSGELQIGADQYVTLQLNASLDGVAAAINNMRLRQMDFGQFDPLTVAPDAPNPDELQGFALSTSQVSDECPDGCIYTLGDTTRTLAAFTSGGTATAQGTIVLGPLPVIPGLANGTVTITPRGLGADDAQVVMRVVQSGLSANASHVATAGQMHCSGPNNSTGTNMVTVVTIIIINVTVQMRDALCGGSTQLADVAFDSVDAPADVVAGTDLVHTATARNIGPNPASGLFIEAAYEDAGLGDPTVDCAGATVDASAGLVRCTWPATSPANPPVGAGSVTGGTARNAVRTAVLTWATDSGDVGSGVTVDYTAGSATPGAGDSASVTSTVQDAVGNLTIVDASAPEAAVAGQGDVSHSVTVRNDGPSDAVELRIEGTTNGALGTPTVTCSDGGTVDGTACVWSGATPAGDERTATLTWAVPEGTPTTTVTVDWEATSATAGATATATTSTTVDTVVANLTLSALDADARVAPGGTIEHVVTAANLGPSAAPTLRILADYNDVLGAPSIECSTGGVPHLFDDLDRARCLWFGDTAVAGERTMTLRWAVPEDATLGDLLTVAYRATSDIPGTDGVGTGTTEIQHLAGLTFSSVSAPEFAASGASLVHSATVTNDGGPVTGLVISAVLPSTDVIGAPVVACGTGGTAATADGVSTCTYAAATAPGATRTMTLTWNAAAVNAVVPPAEVATTFAATSNEGGDPEPVTATTTVRANEPALTFSATSAPAVHAPLSGTNGNLVHTATVRNDGDPASNVVIVADLPVTGTIPNPGVACGTGGTAGAAAPHPEIPDVLQVRCTYNGFTASNATRTMTLTWTGANVVTAGAGKTVAVTFNATSLQGGDAEPASTSTEILTGVANVGTINNPSGQTGATGLTSNNLVHGASVARQQPVVGSSTVVIRGSYDPALPAPNVSCTGAVVPAGEPVVGEEGVIECTWAAGTATTARVMTFTWPANTLEPGTYQSSFSSDASLPGARASVTRTSTLSLSRPELAFIGVISPPTVPAGEDVVHVVDVRNVGNLSANNVAVTATYDPALGDPTVVCGGTATTAVTPVFVEPGVVRCTWTGATAVNTVGRRMSLKWTSDDLAGEVVQVGYVATADAPAAPASASSTSTVVAP